MLSFLRRQGDKAEERAAKYLKDKGYKILKRNYLCPLGEVDIIAKKDGAIVFVEVKQRSSADFGGKIIEGKLGGRGGYKSKAEKSRQSGRKLP